MRRVLMALLSALILASLTVTAVLLSSAPVSAPATIVLPTPSATPTLPMCITEDGAGQALCWWDAQQQGNGQGTSMVSGDCAPSIMGEASGVCVNLHSRESVTIANEDGSLNTISNGADLIAECTSEFDGIELQNCIREWHKN